MTSQPQFSYALADGTRVTASRHDDVGAVLQQGASSERNLGLCARLAKSLLLGHEPWSFALEAHGSSEIIGFATHAAGTLHRSFEITVFPELGARHGFWDALSAFAERSSVTQLLVEQISAAFSDEPMIPSLQGETERYSNIRMYVWNLADSSWDRAISANHRRNIGRARKQGVGLASLSPADAVSVHLKLIGASLTRRSARGEPTNFASDEREVHEVLGTGRAEMFQASLDGEIVSSMIVYTLGPFAYYDSGGTSQPGMSVGASHFLMYSIAGLLRDRGISSLNLDVASVAAGGLARYKAEFGAEQWMVERVRCNLRSPARVFRNVVRRGLRRWMPGAIGN